MIKSDYKIDQFLQIVLRLWTVRYKKAGHQWITGL